jgi:two-component system, NtrC family, response regulator HydG
MAAADSSSRDIDFALRICTLLNAVRAMHESRSSTGLREVLGNHICEFIRELIPAERGAVLIEDQIPWDSPERQLLERVSTEGAVILDSAEEGYTLAVLLLVRSEPAGMIYLRNGRTQPPFNESHLMLLTAIAQIASVALENAFHMEWLAGEVRRLTLAADGGDEMAGDSRKMSELRTRIARVAPTNTTILILGESGTGKELVARSLHRQSPRSNRPFVAINCAALTESLLESELFGHEKGAFTGALTQKLGRLETAQGGSVFLDEVGEMPLSLQSKLLRVLQNREFERVGGVRTIRLDVRLIGATNRNLEDAVRHGSFREDLFYRLNVITLWAPPLREHPEDIIALAQHFAMRFGERHGRRISGISPSARSVLQSYEWPGNVRELENAIEHAVVLGYGDTLLAEDLPDAIRERWEEVTSRETGMLHRSINASKRTAVRRAFEIAKNDHAEAAKLLGVHPNYLYRLLRNLK